MCAIRGARRSAHPTTSLTRSDKVAPEEAKVLSHGGPLEPVGIGGPYAVFDPDGDVLAIVSERDGRARAEIVLAPA